MRHLMLLVFLILTSYVKAQETASYVNSLIGAGVNGYGIILDGEAQWPPSYYNEIAAAGFSSVRIVYIENLNSDINETTLNMLQGIVDECLSAGLLPIIDYHYTEWGTYTDEKGELFVNNWAAIAAHFHEYTNDQVVFELSNEPFSGQPVFISAEMWNELMNDLITAIRPYNNYRVIIVSPLYFPFKRYIGELDLPEDDYLILSIHYYEPEWLINQNVPDNWNNPGTQYAGTHWRNIQPMVDNLEADFAPVFEFQAANNKIPVTIGEYGTRIFCDPDNRRAYFTLLCRWWESKGFSHMVWSFDNDFGIMKNPTLGYDSPREWYEGIPEAIISDPLVLYPYECTSLIQSDFSSTTGWSTDNSDGGALDISASGGELVINVTAPGETNYYNAVVRSPTFDLEKNSIYRVTYTIRTSSGSRTFAHRYSDSEHHPWYYTYDLGTSPETIVETYIMPIATQNDACFEILVGLYTGTLFLENFTLEKITALESVPLLAHWPFDGNGNDVTGNGHDVILHDYACYEMTNPKLGSHALGFCGCPGISDPIDLGIYNFSTAITTAFWADFGYGNYITFLKGYNQNGQIKFTLDYDRSNNQFVLRTGNITGGEWLEMRTTDSFTESENPEYDHIIFSLDKTIQSVKVIMNGVPLELTGSADLSFIDELVDLRIGGNGYNDKAHRYDDLRLYDRILTSDEIAELIMIDEPNPPSGLTAAPISSSSVRLTWVDNSNDETRFIITRYPYSIPFCNSKIITVDPNVTSYMDNELFLDFTEINRYFYKVRAIKENINSDNTDLIGVCGFNAKTRGQGIVTPGSGFYPEGTTVSLEAIPDSGWQFVEWTGDISSTDNPVSVLVDNPKSITAVFEEIQQNNRIIKVNFGHPWFPAPADWNDINDVPNAGVGIPDLLDEEGNPTGYDIYLLDSWTGYEYLGGNPGIYPDNVMKTDYCLWDDNIRRIELSDLDINSTYDLTIFASRWANYGVTGYTVNGVTQQLETLDNLSETVTFSQATPDQDGKILIHCQRLNSFGHINSLVITEHGQNEGNHAPMAAADTYSGITQGGTLVVDTAEGILINDSDEDQDMLSAVLESDVSYGELTLNPDGSFEYIHDGSSNFTDMFSYKAFDGEDYSAAAEVQLNITPSGGEEITIKVNFGHPWFPVPSDWNDITAVPNAGVGLTDLVDEEGNSTGYDIYLLDSWTGYEYLGAFPGIYPDNVMKTDYYLWDDNVRRIELSNLDQQSTYDLTIFASRWANYGVTGFTVNGVTKQLETLDNVSETVTFNQVTPDQDDKILIQCQRLNSFGHINSLVILEHATSQKSANGLSQINSGIYLYPNPVTNDLIIENLPENCIIRLYNVLGEKKNEYPNYTHTRLSVPMAEYNSGTYIIQIIDPELSRISNHHIIRK